jgi:hypothetical protein
LFIDGNGYAKVRRRLAERFATLHVTALPDKAFKADVEVALLIATDPVPHDLCHIVMRKVNDTSDDWRKFELQHHVSTEYITDLPASDIERSLPIPDLPDVWGFLADYPTLGEHATFRRGLEWNEPLTKNHIETGNRAKFVKKNREEGYMKGVAPRATFNVFQVPDMSYLSVKPKHQRVSAWKHDWGKPKAILNKSARSRGPWRLAAFPDIEGVTCYQTFTGVWPKSERFDEWTLSAVLNSPVANAFVAAREGKTDVTIDTLRSIPVPRFTEVEAGRLRQLIGQYQKGTGSPLYGGEPGIVLERLLKEIDATVLSAYKMPPILERRLLDFFRGHERSTSHAFTEYFPADCGVYFSLLDYLSPEFASATIGELLKRAENH